MINVFLFPRKIVKRRKKDIKRKISFLLNNDIATWLAMPIVLIEFLVKMDEREYPQSNEFLGVCNVT